MPSTGALTIYESLRLDLRLIKRLGLLKPGKVEKGVLTWSAFGEQVAAMDVVGYHRINGQSSILLIYSIARNNGTVTQHVEEIEIVEVDSNLGLGKVLFFVCPVSRKLCRNLHRTPQSGKFQHRECYTEHGKRLYYDCQIASHLTRYRECSFRTEKKLDAMRPFRREYAGRETKSYKRYDFLLQKKFKAEHEMWNGRGLPVALKRAVARGNKKYVG